MKRCQYNGSWLVARGSWLVRDSVPVNFPANYFRTFCYSNFASRPSVSHLGGICA